MADVIIIGGGLAGSEACWQLSKRGLKVKLYEMRPVKMTKAHKTGKLAELVCSNSFRGADLKNAVGLLKYELQILDSLIMMAAAESRVPAGGAFAVDRDFFSQFIDAKIREDNNIEVIDQEIANLEDFVGEHAVLDIPVIVATGPLTSPALAKYIEDISGLGRLQFFDAISPIILNSSIDKSKLFYQSRYDKGEGEDYLNIPLTKELYEEFINDVENAEKFGGHEEVESDMVDNLRPFEGCMPIEEMVARGRDTLRFGPMKPVGLTDPTTGRRPYAVIQLRQDDKAGNLWSLVGFQTKMKHPEQLRVFKKLPGLENAEFVRLGSVHRNSFIDSPKLLNPNLEFKTRKGLFFAGQITGVEGYVESTASGLVAAINCLKYIKNEPSLSFPSTTAIGALIGYVTEEGKKNFQPMNVNFGLMPDYSSQISQVHKKNKDEVRLSIAERALEEIRGIKDRYLL